MIIKIYHSMLWLLVFISYLIVSTDVYALEKRVALVIGNGQYNDAPLKNPVNDASDIANSLEDLEFEVIRGTNVNRKELLQKIREFGQLLKQADVGFFYFAGHGIQFNGENYLIPVATDIQSVEDVVSEATSVSTVLLRMDGAGNAVNIVVLDACRNNPFASSTRSFGRGLTRLDGPTGSYIAFATAPGKTAFDGHGENGLYTKYLLQFMQTPGLSIEQVFKNVRIGVITETNMKQVPWENSSLLGDFYFKDKHPDDHITDSNDTINYELRFWKSADKSASRSFYQAYLEKYPNGHFTDLARSKLKKFDYGHLTIRSNVFQDKIKINGEFRGSSQLDIDLKPGEYQIEVSKEGYIPVQTNVMVKGNERQFVNVQLQAIKKTQENKVNQGFNEGSTAVITDLPKTEEIKTPALPMTANDEIFDMEFIHVKGGCFMMGSEFAEEGRLRDELAHEVCISNDYWLSKYEVSQQQWRAVMGKNPAYFKGCGMDCPVEMVSWNDVQTFIYRLNAKTGLNYRLPTEAEWEYAARAGTSSAIYTGDPEWNETNNIPELDEIAWYSGNSGVSYKGGKYCADWENKQKDSERCGTHPVGKKQANRWGFHDMIGNVWEWTDDWYGSYSSKQKQDPKGPKKGNMRVVRGGNWMDSLQQNRAAARYGFGVRSKNHHIGFRLVR